jgi:hypothetical protein
MSRPFKPGPFYQPLTVGDVDRMAFIKAHRHWTVYEVASRLSRMGLECSHEHLMKLYTDCHVQPPSRSASA